MLNETTTFWLCDVYGHVYSTQNVRTFKILLLHCCGFNLPSQHLYVEKLMENKDQITYLCAYSSLRQQLLVEMLEVKWFQSEGTYAVWLAADEQEWIHGPFSWRSRSATESAVEDSPYYPRVSPTCEACLQLASSQIKTIPERFILRTGTNLGLLYGFYRGFRLNLNFLQIKF